MSAINDLHLWGGQQEAVCPVCGGALNAATPLQTAEEDLHDPMEYTGMAALVHRLIDARPRCPHCRQPLNLHIHLKKEDVP